MTALWVVTSYFNPAGYATKRQNYEAFIAGLDAVGVPHVTIECAFDTQPFELTPTPRVLQVRSADVLWQKERLLNLATAALPAECTKVAWLDCDILFDDPNWVQEVEVMLDTTAVLQPFAAVVRLPRGATYDNGSGRRWRSFAAVYEDDPTIGACGDFGPHGHTGFAWAGRREILDAVGLYDACIAGSADHLMAHVFARQFENACIDRIVGTTGPYREHFRRWARRADALVGGRLRATPGSLRHLWHGDVTNRRYVERNAELARAGYDPESHLALSASGSWQWQDAPHGLREWMVEYFASRKEDGEAVDG